jgi:hypothetical protein
VGATLAECINQMPEEAREPAASADRVKDPEPRGSSLEGTRLGAAERGYGGRCILTRHRRMTMGGRPRASCLGAELGAPTAEQGKEAAVCDPTRRRSNARERQGVAWGFKIPGIFPPAAVAGIGCRLLPDGSDASKARRTAIGCGAVHLLIVPVRLSVIAAGAWPLTSHLRSWQPTGAAHGSRE